MLCCLPGLKRNGYHVFPANCCSHPDHGHGNNRGVDLNIGPTFASAYARCRVFVSRHQALDQTTVVYSSARDWNDLEEHQLVNPSQELVWMNGLMLDKNAQQHGYTWVFDASGFATGMMERVVRVN